MKTNKQVLGKGIASPSPKVVTPKGSAPFHSAEKLFSASPASPLGGKEKVVPHYLRASTGSCHDLCKYGKRNEFENKERGHLPRKISGNETLPRRENQLQSFIAERKKKLSEQQRASSKVQPKPSDGNKTLTGSVVVLCKSNESVECNEDIRQSNSSSLSKSESAVKQSPATLSSSKSESSEHPDTFQSNGASNMEETKQQDELEETNDRVQETLSLPNGNNHSEQLTNMKSETPPVGKVGLSKKTRSTRKTGIVEENVVPVKRNLPSSRSKAKQECSPGLRKFNTSSKRAANGKVVAISPVKIAASTVEVTPQTSSKHAATVNIAALSLKPTPQASPKHAATVKIAASTKKPTPQMMKLRSPLKAVPAGKVVKNKIIEREVLPTSETRKMSRYLGHVSRKPPSTKGPPFKLRNPTAITSSPSMKKKKEVGKAEHSNDNVKEKTLYAINFGEESVISNLQHGNGDNQSSHPSMPSSSSSMLSFTSYLRGDEEGFEDYETVYTEESGTLSDDKTDNDQPEISKDNGKKEMLRRAAMSRPQEKDTEAYKLKFRRGKVVSVQAESNVPRRLRFKQGRMHGESGNGKGEVHRRSYRKKNIVGNVLNDANPESEIVMLRHQDVQDRKDGQGLFNDVIEVTASKLVEARKSKVKALVGAFETVISLQEIKPIASV